MGSWIKGNPVWFMATVETLVAAVMNLVLVFGVTVTNTQLAAINAAVMIVLTLALGLWAQAPLTRLIDEAKADGFSKGLKAKRH